MKWICPPRLNRKDSVAAICLSWGGAAALPEAYSYACKQLEKHFDVCVEPTPHALKSPEWLYHNPEARAEDLHWALRNQEIKAIFSVIGGDDGVRVARYVDRSLVASNPKIFLGFSDSTIFHSIFFNAGVESYYSPSLLTGFAEEGGVFDYTIESMQQMLCTSAPELRLQASESCWARTRHLWEDSSRFSIPRVREPAMSWRVLQGEKAASGVLYGGCLEVLAWSLGTAVWPEILEDVESIALFIETSEEAPSPESLVRFLRSLAASSLLQKVSVLLFGRPGGDSLSVCEFEKYDQAILQVINVEEGLTDMTVISRMDFGHTDPFMTLPYGRTVYFQPNDGSVTLHNT